MRTPRRNLWIAAQLLAAALLVYFIGRQIAGQWSDLRSQPLDVAPDWVRVVGSAALVLAAHAILVATLRMLLRGWNESLSFWTVARFWSISGFGKYVPGKIWQVTALGAMAHRAGAAPVAAAGAAVIGTIINIATGIALVLGLGWGWLDVLRSDARGIAIVLVALSAIGLAALPFVLPRLASIVSRLSGRPVELTSPPPRIILGAIVGNVIAWILYGVSFWWFVRGLLDAAPGPVWSYVAVYAASYVVGYLFLFAPGGLGPREAVMWSLLSALGLATVKQAVLIAVASRVWLTFLEIVPGLLFLANDRMRRHRPSPTDATRE